MSGQDEYKPLASSDIFSEEGTVSQSQEQPQFDSEITASDSSEEKGGKPAAKAAQKSEGKDGGSGSKPEEAVQKRERVLPTIEDDDAFDYVVPKETYKDHIRHKHHRDHSGTTKIASDEEMNDASAGFVFMSRRKRRKHHHHHHKHRKWRHLAPWKKALIIAGSLILTLAVLLSGTYLILSAIGRGSMHNYDNMEIVTPSEDEKGNDIIRVDNKGRVITYDGVSYEFNDDIASVTFIGTDNGVGEEEKLSMSDAIYILAVDTKTGKVTILGISRDTMTDVDVYSEDGRYIDTENIQIAYSYSYNSDKVSGGANTNKSLSRLFYGLQLDNYFAINFNALTVLNDTIGGVTLTSSMTFVSPIDGRTINKGETVTLHGKEAELYVRKRDIEALDSNNERMRRQQEYITAFISSIIPAAKKNISTVAKLYDEIKVNSDTTLDVSKMTYIAATALTKVRAASDIEFVSLIGEITEGEHAQMNISNEDAIRTMLKVFYTPLAEVPDTAN